jgi:hypothetical protein
MTIIPTSFRLFVDNAFESSTGPQINPRARTNLSQLLRHVASCDNSHFSSVTVDVGSNERIMELVMHTRKTIGSRRHVVTRFLVTTALLGSTFLVGLATTASATGTDHLVVATQPSTTDASGAVLAQQPIIQIFTSGDVLDTSAVGVVSVTITTGLPSTLSGTLTATASGGIATFTNLALNALVGSYTLTFADSTDSPTTTPSAPITVSVGAAAKLAFATAPGPGAVSGVALTPQPVVDVVDSGGNIVTTNTSTVTAAFVGATNTLVNNTKAAVAGVATFSGLAITAAIDTSSGVLDFTDGAFPTLSSVTMTITGPASKLAITTAPSITAANGVALAIQPVITVEDASGAVVKGDTSTVTATLVGGNVGSTLTNNTKVVSGGVATFSGLKINALVGTYTLTFSDGALTPATSATLTDTLGPASQLVVATSPSTFTASGVVLAQQPVIDIEDSGGNLDTAVTTGAVTASIATGTGGALSAGSTANFAAGVAAFIGLTLTGTPGSTYTLSYTGDSLTVTGTAMIDVGQTQAALVVTSVNATYGRPFALATTGGSGTGAVTFTVANGTATGCVVVGNALTSATAGTCIVTATKASDTTYVGVSSVATTVTFAKLAIPGAVRLTFTKNSSGLTGAARNAIVVLIRKLTVHSVVSITGYAKGNAGLAHRRAAAAEKYLSQRLHAHFQEHWNTSASTSSVLIVTKSQ